MAALARTDVAPDPGWQAFGARLLRSPGRLPAAASGHSPYPMQAVVRGSSSAAAGASQETTSVVSVDGGGDAKRLRATPGAEKLVRNQLAIENIAESMRAAAGHCSRLKNTTDRADFDATHVCATDARLSCD